MTMTMKVNLVGEGAPLTMVRDALQAQQIAAAINMPTTEDTPLVVCVPPDKGVTPPLIETFKRAVGQKVQVAAVLLTGGEQSSDMVDLLRHWVFGVLNVFVGEDATSGLLLLEQWKEGWVGELQGVLEKGGATAQIQSPEKWRIKKYSEKAFFK